LAIIKAALGEGGAAPRARVTIRLYEEGFLGNKASRCCRITFAATTSQSASDRDAQTRPSREGRPRQMAGGPRARRRGEQVKKKRARRPKGSPGAFSPSEVPVSPAAAQTGLPRPALPLVKVRC